MVRLIVLAAIVGGIYWYWQGPLKERDVENPQAYWEENERQMKRCMRKENSIAGGAAMVGAGIGTGDVESLCAEKLGMEKIDGRWHTSGAR